MTTAGSAENERSSAPIAGLRGFTSRSTTGARLRLTPTEASVVAMSRPHVVAAASSSSWPIEASESIVGKPVAGVRRATRPPSWSIATMSRRSPARPCRPAVRARSCLGDWTLRGSPVVWSRSNRTMPPRPNLAMASATGPASATVMPRKPTTSRPAIVRRRSAAGLADAIALAVGDTEGETEDEAAGGPLGGAKVGGSVRPLADGRQAATSAAAADRTAQRNPRRLSNRRGLGSGTTRG